MEDDNKKFDLSNYSKGQPDKIDGATTSIYLDKKQLKYIQAKNINLSMLIRDFLDSLIGKDNSND